ncbi:MAG TPA: hypothetical protein PKX41_02480 [Anaerolineaceae bacterium]|nr:hypothetical protein [Anaerolineaceae bacterium]
MKKRRWAKTAAFFEYLWNIYLPYAILVTLEGKTNPPVYQNWRSP